TLDPGPVPIADNRGVARFAEDEGDVGDTGGIALAQVPDAVAEHRGSGGAVAVPVAEHRHIASVAVLERVVSHTRSRRVPQIPDPLPNHRGPRFMGARHNRGRISAEAVGTRGTATHVAKSATAPTAAQHVRRVTRPTYPRKR